MDRILSILKDYYIRECRMNMIYCSILRQVGSSSNNNGHYSMLITIINYLTLDTYKNVTVLGEMLSKVMHYAASDIDSRRCSIPVNINHVDVGDILNLLSTILRIEKGLSYSMVHDYTEFYEEDDGCHHNHDDNNNNDEESYIKGILHCISIDIEERINILSSLTRALNAIVFCICGYELPRLVSIVDVQEGCIYSSKSKSMSNSSNSTSSKMMLTIQCPRCGKVYHGMIDGSGSTCNGRESSNDLHCYS
ncbi:MAG: hypothetical protein QW712_06580 [Candidatus Nitrosocaldus sp.]